MFKNSTEKFIYFICGFQFNKMTFELEKQLHQKQFILQRTMPCTFLMKNFLWKKNYMIVTYYPHQKKHS